MRSGAQVRGLVKDYDPDQPRVPAGNPDGGQWTTDDAGTVQIAQGPGRPGYPIDLTEHEAARGIGHTIRDHVGKSEQYLLSVVTDIAQRAERLGDLAGELSEGSFPSLEAANKLVSATVAENQTKVDSVINGSVNGAQFEAWFSSPTGYEAYAANERSQPDIRETYGVRVVVVRDSDSASGFQILTAFPISR